jgi:threonine/homoserine/homoserine lactone efflux protein
VWAILALVGAASMIQTWIIRLTLSLLGIGFLVYLAVKAIKDSRINIIPGSASVSQRGDLVTGALLSLSNPFAIAFWIGVSTSIFSAVPGVPDRYDYALFFSAFYLALILWCLFMACLVAWGRRFVTLVFFRWLNLSCGLALGFFALQLGYKLTLNLL